MIGRQNYMFSKVLLGQRPGSLGAKMVPRAAFSSEVATSGAAAGKASGLKTLWQYSAMATQKNAAAEAADAQYFDSLKQAQSVPGAFSKLSETGSSKHLADIRKTINKTVE